MAEAGRDLTATLFGATTATAAPVDQWRQTLKLDDLERQYQLPSGLMTSVLRQESGGDPRVKSSAGAQGIFQFMPATARQYKIDPFDPQQAAPAAAKELSSLYRKYHGDVDMTLAAWNWGQGNVDRKGIANMPSETRGFLTNVKRFMGPGVAEAASPGGRDLTGTLGQASGGSGRDLTDMLFGTPAPDTPPQTSQPPPQATTPTAQPPAPASEKVAPTAPQAPPAPSPDPSPTPGIRFQTLPSITQLEPADRMQKTKLFESLKPEKQEEFLRGEEPVAGGLAMGGGPVAQSQPVTDPAAALAMGRRAAGWREGDPLPPEAKRPPTPTEAPVEEGMTAPSTMIPLLMPGAGLKFVPKPAAEVLKEGVPWAYRGARAAAEGLSQTLGWTAGKTAETGQVPSLGDIGTEAAFNVAAGGILEGLGATGQAILRRSQAGKAIVAADEATTAARQTWEQEVATARAELQAGRTEAYQAAERRAKAAQAQYQAKVQARDATIAANQQEYQQAVTAHRAEVQAEQGARYGEARTEAIGETAAARARQQQYGQAVAGQERAITTARATPGRYTPETPSWVLYEKYGDAAKDTVLDLSPAKTAVAELRAQRGVLPDGSMRPFPAAVEDIASNLEKASGIEGVKFETVRQELRKLGPLSRSSDGNVRGPAKQLMGIYADVLEASPIANDLLKNANATFRKEMAVQDIADWLKPGHGIVRIDNMGRETINVGALMTRLEKTVADDSLFRRSFAPDELDALRKDLRQLAGTPAMPRGQMPPAARPELLPGAAPTVPARMAQPPTAPAVPREVTPPRQELLPGAAPGRRGTEEQRGLLAPGAEPPAAVTPRQQLGERPRFTPTEGQLGAVGGLAYLGQLFGIPMKAVAALKAGSMVSKQLRYGTARMILGAQSRPQLMETLRKVQGRVGPPLYGTLLHGLSAAERKALQRETKEQQR